MNEAQRRNLTLEEKWRYGVLCSEQDLIDLHDGLDEGERDEMYDHGVEDSRFNAKEEVIENMVGGYLDAYL